jgi:hypothetical protein
MTMHLVRGMSTTSTKKRKTQNKTRSLLKAEAALAKHYAKLGIGKVVPNAHLDIPDYRSKDKSIPSFGHGIGNGFKKESNVYTGNEIAGIATMHKSNAVPVRKDSNEAIEIANMRR